MILLLCLTNGNLTLAIYLIFLITNHRFTGDKITTDDIISPFYIFEVRKAVENAKTIKAIGANDLYAEERKDDSAVFFILSLCNVCFNKSIVPAIWNK